MAISFFTNRLEGGTCKREARVLLVDPVAGCPARRPVRARVAESLDLFCLNHRITKKSCRVSKTLA